MVLQVKSAPPSVPPLVVSDTGQRVYRASLTPVVAGVGIVGFFLVLGSIFGRSAGGIITGAIVAGFAFVLGFVGALTYTGARLIVAPEGVTYHTLGYTLSVPWDDVLGAATATYGGGTMEVLALRQNAITLHRSRHFGLGMPPLAKSIALAHGQAGQDSEAVSDGAGYIIPVGLLRAWETGELQREMKRYAPQLFE